MWAEPLIATTEPLASHTVAVTVHDAAGTPCAAVLCAYSLESGTGSLGEMRVLDERGGPRQRVRALALLVREALRYANALGLERVRTEAPERLMPFAARMSGLAGERARGRRVLEGELQAVRTAALRASGDDGSLRGLTPEEAREVEEAVDAAVDVRR
jgi:hypothetical protein